MLIDFIIICIIDRYKQKKTHIIIRGWIAYVLYLQQYQGMFP
jgi:hypothetical protein